MATQARSKSGTFTKKSVLAEPQDAVEEAIMHEVVAAAGALSTPPEPAQLERAATAASAAYQQPTDLAHGKVSDVTALVSQELARAGIPIPGGARGLEAYLLSQTEQGDGTVINDGFAESLRGLLPQDVIKEKTEIARAAYEAVSADLARGGGKRANTARLLRQEGLVPVTVPTSCVFCFNGLWVEMPAGSYSVPYSIAVHYQKAVALAAQTEREDLQMRWQMIVNTNDPLQRLKRVEPTQFRIY